MSRTLVALAMLGGLVGGPLIAADNPAPTQDATAPSGPSRHALDAAISGLRGQIAANPKDAVSHNRLGVCYQQKGQVKLARKEYQLAARLDPQYPEAWNNLGTIEHANRKYKKAVAHYRKAIELKPENASFHRNLGAAWLESGNYALAASAYATAYSLDPTSLQSGASIGPNPATVDHGRLFFVYAKLFAAKGDLESAFMWLARARESGFRSFEKVSSDPDFAELVKDPRFEDLRR